MALDTDWIRQVTIAVSIWLSGAHASLAKDFAGSGCRIGPILDESSAGAANASNGVCVLRLSRDATNGGSCGAFARDAPGVFYFLSLVIERPQRVFVRRLSLHVCLSRFQGGTSMETLFIGSSPRCFVKHSNSIAFLRAVVAGHASASSERHAMALVPSLRCFSCGFRAGSQPCAAAEHDPVSFAVEDRLRFLGPVFN